MRPGPIKAFVVASLLLVTVSWAAFGWPDRPLRVVVGFQAGGSSDVVARPGAGRPGAPGAVAADSVLNAHDGHSLLSFSDSLVTSALTNKSVRYQPLRDFKMISLLCEGTLVLLAASNAPFRNF